MGHFLQLNNRGERGISPNALVCMTARICWRTTCNKSIALKRSLPFPPQGGIQLWRGNPELHATKERQDETAKYDDGTNHYFTGRVSWVRTQHDNT